MRSAWGRRCTGRMPAGALGRSGPAVVVARVRGRVRGRGHRAPTRSTGAATFTMRARATGAHATDAWERGRPQPPKTRTHIPCTTPAPAFKTHVCRPPAKVRRNLALRMQCRFSARLDPPARPPARTPARPHVPGWLRSLRACFSSFSSDDIFVLRAAISSFCTWLVCRNSYEACTPGQAAHGTRWGARRGCRAGAARDGKRQ